MRLGSILMDLQLYIKSCHFTLLSCLSRVCHNELIYAVKSCSLSRPFSIYYLQIKWILPVPDINALCGDGHGMDLPSVRPGQKVTRGFLLISVYHTLCIDTYYGLPIGEVCPVANDKR